METGTFGDADVFAANLTVIRQRYRKVSTYPFLPRYRFPQFKFEIVATVTMHNCRPRVVEGIIGWLIEKLSL